MISVPASFSSHWVTLYTDSLVHDDVSPVSAPRRAGFHPGIYLARFPGLEHLDLRLREQTPITRQRVFINQASFSTGNTFKGKDQRTKAFWSATGLDGRARAVRLGSPITSLRRRRCSSSIATPRLQVAFIPGGTTQNDFAFQVVKRVRKDIELRGWVQYERWKAPIYEPGLQSDTTASFQVTWFAPERKSDSARDQWLT